ncbi:unnamed protein product [Brachionus calyciflorus]|uniref:Uncharacterized protein n=1 Tax=Brachionus calyciflorus TaxID=104777 RepID=A0A814BGV9_9BILA|nr:unnamed protein product [Brachionus calyciflorus]
MILNNMFEKWEPKKSKNFQKIVESNIDFIKYRDKIVISTLAKVKSKKQVNDTANNLRSISLADGFTLKSEFSKTISYNTNISKTLKYKDEKHKRLERVSSKFSILNSDFGLYDPNFVLEKSDKMKKNSKILSKHQLFNTTTVDSKFAQNTSDLYLKSPINFNSKNPDFNLKLPQLNSLRTFQSDKSNDSQEKDVIQINRLSPKSKYSINNLSNITKHLISEDYCSLPLINGKEKNNPTSNDFSIKSEKLCLNDKNKFFSEKYPDNEKIKNKEKMKDQVDFDSQSFTKPKFELILNKMNRKKESYQENESIEDGLVQKAKKRERLKPTYTPSIKFSQIDDKLYLEIFMPSVM